VADLAHFALVGLCRDCASTQSVRSASLSSSARDEAAHQSYAKNHHDQ
jgi:hypothetical protein